MGTDPISSGIDAAGDIAGAYINQQTAEADAKEAAQAQLDYANTVFKNETGYESNQQQAGRDAMISASDQFGNPYAQAGSIAKPTALTAPSQFGGTQFSGANGGAAVASGFSGTPVGSTQTSPTDADGTPARLPNTPTAGGGIGAGFAGNPTRRYPTGGSTATPPAGMT